MKAKMSFCVWLLLFIIPLFAQNVNVEVTSPTALALNSGRKLLSLSKNNDPIFIVSTLDGNLHGIDVKNAEILWSLNTPPGGPLLSSSTNFPHETEEEKKQVQVIPSVNGNIYLHIPGEPGVQKLPLNAKELVDLSPFTALDGTLYMSNKQTTGFLVNIHTGKLRCILRDKNKQFYASEYNACTSFPSSEDEDELIFMVRVDYVINAIDSASGKLKWNITFSDCYPSNQDSDIPTSSMAFSTNDGALYYLNHTTATKPTIFQLSSQPVSLFKQLEDEAANKFQRINMLHITVSGSHGFNPFLGDEPSVYVSTDSEGALYAFEVNPLLLLKSKQERLSLPPTSNNSSPSSNTTPHSTFPVAIQNKPPTSSNPQHSKRKKNKKERVHLITGFHALRPFTYNQCLNPSVLRNSKGDSTVWMASLQGVDSCKEYDPTGRCILYGQNRTQITPIPDESFLMSKSGLAVVFVSIVLAGVLYFNILAYRQKRVEQQVAQLQKENAEFKQKEEQEQLRKALELEQKRLADIEAEKQAKIKEAEEAALREKQAKEKDAPVATVGKIKLHKKKMLGHGSNGTVVFEGELIDHFNRKVAVKRMLREFYDAANHEVSLLIESDEHPHVVRYFAREDDEQFIYLALELCDSSLEKVVSEKKGKFKLDQKIHLLAQLCKAVEHIHNLNIVHRDLKPQNVLVSLDGKIKLSDMGLGRKLGTNKTSFHTTNSSAGTVGWQAPELIHDENEGMPLRKTRAVDVFALGCILYYVLSDGQHPFGERLEREMNIMNQSPKMNYPLPAECIDLISQMTQHDASKRPKASEVLSHCMFWDDNKRLNFLCDVSDQLGKEQMTSKVYQILQTKKTELWKGETWDKAIDPPILQGVTSFRKYDFKKVWDLLRLLRNMKGHYREYDEKVQNALAPLPQGIYRYFSKKFPTLFFVIFKLVRESDWPQTPIFQPYFEK